MKTENTENNEEKGWVFYDGQCRRCRAALLRHQALFLRHGLGCTPQQAPWARQRLGLHPDQAPVELKVLTPAGALLGGAAAILYLAGCFRWTRPFLWIAKLPGAFPVLQSIYRFVARYRSCYGGVCQLKEKP